MRSHTESLSIAESKRLIELEKTIARGKKTFVEVGLALAEIRDLKLYKHEHNSFEVYCREKWGWEKAYANHVIRAADAVKCLPENLATIVATEGQARELGKIPAEHRAGVVQAIVDEGKSVTAAEIKRHLVRAGRTTDPERRAEDCAPYPPPPSRVLDSTGWPIPTQLIPLWQRADEVQEMLTTLSRVKGALRAAQENCDKLFGEVNFSSALSQLDQAWTDIKTAKPFAVCPTCQGQLPDKCTLCKGRGLISEHRWNTCVTREDKEFRVRAARATGKKN
jgi:hypothetical protein